MIIIALPVSDFDRVANDLRKQGYTIIWAANQTEVYARVQGRINEIV